MGLSAVLLFQFQSGAIKRTQSRRTGLEKSKFQFQSGAIKRTEQRTVNDLIPRFNSKVVRLKVY